MSLKIIICFLLLIRKNIIRCSGQPCLDLSKTFIKSMDITNDAIETCIDVPDVTSYISGYLDTCSYTADDATRFPQCFSNCWGDDECKAFYYSAHSGCMLCHSVDSDGNGNSQDRSEVFIADTIFGLYIDCKYFIFKCEKSMKCSAVKMHFIPASDFT